MPPPTTRSPRAETSFGTAGEIVSRLLRGFEREGRLKLGREQIVLLTAFTGGSGSGRSRAKLALAQRLADHGH